MIHRCLALQIVQTTILKEIKGKQSFDLSIAYEIQSELQVLIFFTPIHAQTLLNPDLVDSIVASNIPEGTVLRCVSQSRRRVVNVPIFNMGPQFSNKCYGFPKWTRATMVTKVDNDLQIGEPISLVVATCPELNPVKRQVFVILLATILPKSMVSKTVSASPESRSF